MAVFPRRTGRAPGSAVRPACRRPGLNGARETSVRSPTLHDLPTAIRLACGLFLLSLLGFYGVAQVQLVLSAGGGEWPGPAAVLAKYHGSRKGSRLHTALDPSRPDSDPKAMYANLGETDAERSERRRSILGWVEAGATRSAWPLVEPIFTTPQGCARCHSRAEGGTRAKADLPFDRYEDVLAVTEVDTGMTPAALALSSHNHIVGFAVTSLLSSLAFALTRWPRRVVLPMIVAAFLGPAIDVSSWWLTHRYGHPFEYGVMAGGGLYGLALVGMASLSLDELWLGSRIRRAVCRALPMLGNSDAEPPQEARA